MSVSRLLGPVSVALSLVFAASGHAQQVYKNVASNKLEKILTDLSIDFKKTNGDKDGIHFYDYSRNGYKIRLHNYHGKDLWIDAVFTDKMSADDANRWNVRAKFSRCVLLNTNDKATVSLENQFDCLGGCTDAIVRQFVVRFDGEVRDFVEFVKNAQAR
jgi:hypothetical protein